MLSEFLTFYNNLEKFKIVNSENDNSFVSLINSYSVKLFKALISRLMSYFNFFSSFFLKF